MSDMLNLLPWKARPPKKPEVWLVEDQESIRERFRDAHEEFFQVRLFKSPTEVLAALNDHSPQALLCDIHFVDEHDPPDIGPRMAAEEDRLREFARELGMGDEAGTILIEMVRNKFKGSPPFPVYAYTGKAAFLMYSPDFERLIKADARWLFKDKYSPEAVRLVILRDIGELAALHGWRSRTWAHLRPVLAVTGAFGWLLGRLLEFLLFGR